VFLGRQQRSVTVYHYGPDDRLAWSETVSEPDWTDDDLDAALSWQTEDDMRCTGCGHPVDETYDDEQAAAWVTEQVICWSCASRDRLLKNTKGAPDGARYRTRNRAHDNRG
jgi:hypothetical protein